MKVTLTAITFVAAMTAAAPVRADDGATAAAPPSLSDRQAERSADSEALPASPGILLAAYGIRCTFKRGSRTSRRPRPLRWLVNRCRPWAA
jgi:hypothetical protein